MRLFVLCGLGMLAAGPLACTGPGLEPPGSDNSSDGDHQEDAGDFGNPDGAASGGMGGDGDAASGGTQAVPPLAGGFGGVGGGAGGAGGMSAGSGGSGDQDSGVIDPDEDAGVDPTDMNP